MGNSNLHKAKAAKQDEFYTQLSDIEKEMVHYKSFFNGKTVYCNCDDARESNFFKYFSLNFEHLGLKKLICTGYKENGHGVILIYEGDKNGNRNIDDGEIEVKELQGNGDFRSEECIEYLKQADVVVTNPPFSLFREYVVQLMEYNKKFIIVGNMNAITYKEIFPLIKNNQLWLGASGFKDMSFKVPSYYEEKSCRFWVDENGQKWRSLGNGCWFSNVEHKRRNEKLDLYKKYNEKEFPKYDNYNAIEVSRVENIPMDYNGIMGVPITFLDKYNPTQFEIVKFRKGNDDKDLSVNGKCPYFRILIRRKTDNPNAEVGQKQETIIKKEEPLQLSFDF